MIIDGTNYDSAATGKVWLYLGDSANVTTLSSLPSNAGFSLMLDAGEEIAVNSAVSTAGSLGLSAEDINIGASAPSSARSRSTSRRSTGRARRLDAAHGHANALNAVVGDGRNLSTIAGSLTAHRGDHRFVARRQYGEGAWRCADDAAHHRCNPGQHIDGVAGSDRFADRFDGSATADTDVDVDIIVTRVPIPNFLGLTEVVIPDSVAQPAQHLDRSHQ